LINLFPVALATEYNIMSEELPPWNYTENGSPTSVTVEIVREILKKLITNYDYNLSEGKSSPHDQVRSQ